MMRILEDTQYTFEELSEMGSGHLDKILEEKRSILYAWQSKKWQTAATILFYQNEIEKERMSTSEGQVHKGDRNENG